jgi:hypothetical protein
MIHLGVNTLIYGERGKYCAKVTWQWVNRKPKVVIQGYKPRIIEREALLLCLV